MEFIDDDEKMRDFFKLTKKEFLKSYSYLNENDYNATKMRVEQSRILELTYAGIDSWDRPIYKNKRGVLFKDTALGKGNNLRKSLFTSTKNSFDGEPLARTR